MREEEADGVGEMKLLRFVEDRIRKTIYISGKKIILDDFWRHATKQGQLNVQKISSPRKGDK